MSLTLDWQARQNNLSSNDTTLSAGLGYADDRENRRVECFVSLAVNEPFVGTKQSDMAIIDSASNIFPWIVDRQSIPSKWWRSHQNGRPVLERDDDDDQAAGHYEQLYTAAWIGTKGEAWLYYPPLSVYGHPLTFGDVLGSSYESQHEEFVKPNLPENNPGRISYFTKPYPDSAVPGLSLITAQAPVYLSGSFSTGDGASEESFYYDQTYLASTGVDIAVSAVSSYLDVLQDSLTPSSFGMLVDADFSTLVISQEVVNRVYPKLTGIEDERVTYDPVTGNIVEDRRGVPYLPSDTILQGLTQLSNANWTALLDTVRALAPGKRGMTKFNITLTGHDEATSTEYHVLFHKWRTVANWTLLVFAPVKEVEQAIGVSVVATDPNERNTTTKEDSSNDSGQNEISLLSLEGIKGDIIRGKGYFVNHGNLDVTVSVKRFPHWVKLSDTTLVESTRILQSGQWLAVEFQVETSDLSVGTQSSSIVFQVEDDDYPDCLYQEELSLQVTVVVSALDCGKRNSEMDTNTGECVCASKYLHLPWSGACVSYATLFLSLLTPLVAIPLLLLYVREWRRRRVADSTWKSIPPNSTLTSICLLAALLEKSTWPNIVERKWPSRRFIKLVQVDAVVRLMNWTAGLDNRILKRVLFVTRRQTTWKCPGTEKMRRQMMLSARTILNLFLWVHFAIPTLTREMRRFTSLRHHCVATTMGAVTRRGRVPVLVLEYQAQGSLYDILRSSMVELEGELVKGILSDVAQGMQYLHRTKPQVTHGDLKTYNILIDSKFRAKVGGFELNYKRGTSVWAAPELESDEAKATTATDVYDFGIVLHEIFSRPVGLSKSDALEDNFRVPEGPLSSDVKSSSVVLRPSVPASMPTGIAALFNDCLRNNPEERPTMDEIANRICRFDEAEVEPVGLMKRTKKSSEKSFDLLLKVFPRHIAEQLRDGKEVDPEQHECCTVFFSDIVNFTTLSSELSPKKVSDMLHRLFYAFDSLAGRLFVREKAFCLAF